jgi:hypothetical protein
MSKIAISGASTGTATFTIESPATSTNRTLTLPDNTGTIITQNSTPAFASTIGVGGATAAASGAGITFPGTVSASSDANTLDDYEEGNFTPAFTFASGSVTYSEQSAFYVKVGRFVQCNIALYISGLSSPSGGVQITGMPFTAGTGERFVCAWNIGLARDFASALTLTGYIGNNNTILQISKGLANGTFTQLQGSDFTAQTGFYISIGYFTA